MEFRITRSLPGDEVEEIPLRHERDEFAMPRHMPEVANGDERILQLKPNGTYFLMRALEELFQNAEFVHQLEGRWMDRIPAKIAQKIAMFLKHPNIDACPPQQEAEDHARRPAASNAACRGDLRRHRALFWL